MSFHGTPCWFELMTTDLPGAQTFYSALLGWKVKDSGMPDMDYRMADTGTGTVGGMMLRPAPEIPPCWLMYVAVESCDAAVALTTGAGGKLLAGPFDLPGVGRMATLADPWGGAFAVLQPAPDSSPEGDPPFHPEREGHVNWLELMATDSAAALAFYNKLFGWTLDGEMPMGDGAPYRLFAHKGRQIGGVVEGLYGAPLPWWLPYFGTGNIDAAVTRVTEAGGTVHVGPMEVPGPAFIINGADPQGAMFALVGTR